MTRAVDPGVADRPFLVRWALGVPAIVLAMVLVGWCLRSRVRPTSDALLAMPAGERAAMYRRALEDLEVCEARADPRLDRACRERAELLLLFPECGAACRERAERFLPAPTR